MFFSDANLRATGARSSSRSSVRGSPRSSVLPLSARPHAREASSSDALARRADIVIAAAVAAVVWPLEGRSPSPSFRRQATSPHAASAAARAPSPPPDAVLAEGAAGRAHSPPAARPPGRACRGLGAQHLPSALVAGGAGAATSSAAVLLKRDQTPTPRPARFAWTQRAWPRRRISISACSCARSPPRRARLAASSDARAPPSCPPPSSPPTHPPTSPSRHDTSPAAPGATTASWPPRSPACRTASSCADPVPDSAPRAPPRRACAGLETSACALIVPRRCHLSAWPRGPALLARHAVVALVRRACDLQRVVVQRLAAESLAFFSICPTVSRPGLWSLLDDLLLRLLRGARGALALRARPPRFRRSASAASARGPERAPGSCASNGSAASAERGGRRHVPSMACFRVTGAFKRLRVLLRPRQPLLRRPSRPPLSPLPPPRRPSP